MLDTWRVSILTAAAVPARCMTNAAPNVNLRNPIMVVDVVIVELQVEDRTWEVVVEVCGITVVKISLFECRRCTTNAFRIV